MFAINQINRDPFARASLMRVTLEKVDRRDCSWCGQPARFRYFWEGDASRSRPPTGYHDPQFCSIGCWRTYWM